MLYFFYFTSHLTFLEICVPHRNTVVTLVWNNPGLRVSTFPIILPTRYNITITKKRIIVSVKHGCLSAPFYIGLYLTYTMLGRVQ